jgi:hypothetical protein
MLFGDEGDTVLPNPPSNEEPTNRLLVPRLVERRSSHRAFGETTGA